MNSVGPRQGQEYQINCDGGYNFPDLNQPGYHGVGVYWATQAAARSEPPGVSHYCGPSGSGTILLAEETGGQQAEGNAWTCVCIGPEASLNGSANGNLYQIDTTSIPQNPTSSSGGVNQGALLYKAQNKRFNYLFCDGHVEALAIEQTVGTGTLLKPAGMWTVRIGD